MTEQDTFEALKRVPFMTVLRVWTDTCEYVTTFFPYGGWTYEVYIKKFREYKAGELIKMYEYDTFRELKKQPYDAIKYTAWADEHRIFRTREGFINHLESNGWEYKEFLDRTYFEHINSVNETPWLHPDFIDHIEKLLTDDK